MSEEDESTIHDVGFEPEPQPRARWRDRLRELRGRDKAVGLRGAIAVGLAGLVIGGAGGWTLSAVSHHDDGHGPGELGRQWGGQQPSDHDGFPAFPDGEEGNHGPPMGGLPGGLPPSTGTDEDQEGYSGGTNS